MPLGYDKRQDNGMGGADMERILLVEDDSAIYQPLTSFLRGEGFGRAGRPPVSAKRLLCWKRRNLTLCCSMLACATGTAFPSARL